MHTRLIELLCTNLTLPPFWLFHSFANVSLFPPFREMSITSILLHGNPCWPLHRTNSSVFSRLHTYSDRKGERSVHILLEILSLESQPSLLWPPTTFVASYTLHALATLACSLVPCFPIAVFVLPTLLPSRYVRPKSCFEIFLILHPFHTFLASSCPTILCCRYYIRASSTQLRAGIRPATLLPALWLLTFESRPVPAIVMPHWPQEAKLSAYHSSHIHSSIRQIFPGYLIPAKVHRVDIDSGIRSPFLLTNFLPNLFLNSWPHTLGPVDLSHHLDTAELNSTVLFCFSWKPLAPGSGPTESSSWTNIQMFSKQDSIPPSLDCCPHMQNSFISRSTFR